MKSINISKYKNIIFDLGGVILTLDYQKTIDEFSKLVGQNFNEFYSQYQQLTFFDQFEKGEISSSQFRNQIRKAFNLQINDEKIDYAWNAMLGHIPEERIEFLNQLNKEKRIFLLSNTNEIHLNALNKIIKRENKIDNFNTYFENTHFSHLVSMRKPEAKIFEYVLKKNKINASETIFIDDSIQHVESAKKLGVDSFLLEKDKSIIEVFEK